MGRVIDWFFEAIALVAFYIVGLYLVPTALYAFLWVEKGYRLPTPQVIGGGVVAANILTALVLSGPFWEIFFDALLAQVLVTYLIAAAMPAYVLLAAFNDLGKDYRPELG